MLTPLTSRLTLRRLPAALINNGSQRRNIIIKSKKPVLPATEGSFAEHMLSTIWNIGSAKPGAMAITNAANPKQRLTYHDVYLQSVAIATYLHKNDIHHGQVIASVLPNVVEFPSISIGIGLTGAALTPISASSTPIELQYQLEDSKAKIIFCADVLLPGVLKAVENFKKAPKIIAVKCAPVDVPLPPNVTPFAEVVSTQPNWGRESVDVNPERDVYLLPYSSGTTGAPKGVMISHHNLASMVPNLTGFFATEILPALTPRKEPLPQEHNLLMMPFNHIFGFGGLMLSLNMGMSTIAMAKFEPELFLKALQTYKIRMLITVPPVLVMFAKHPAVQNVDLSNLEIIVIGAAPISSEAVDAVKSRIKSIKHVMQGFGMTELTMATVIGAPSDNPPMGSCGKILPGNELKIVCPESGRELDYEEKGELWVRGPQTMIGYYNRPQATAETLDDDGWLHTGDIGYVNSDGFVFVVDRLKELIKVNAYQVAPAELEDLLLGHPKVRDAAVVGVRCANHGEVPMAFVVRGSDDVTEAEIEKFVADQVSHYKALRGGVRFVDSIPKSPSGKILRRLLRDPIHE